MRAAILSEDRQLLQDARKRGLRYYNCLMLVLGLYSRKNLNSMRCRELLVLLSSFAHYSERVKAYGQELFEHLVRMEEG